MGKFDSKGVGELKDKVMKSTGKGAKYFFKNCAFVILLLILCYIFTNPDIIMNPGEFVQNFDKSSIFSLVLITIILFILFQIGRSLLQDDRVNLHLIREETDAQTAKEEHDKEIHKRVSRNPEISMVLKDLLINLNGSRATICEMHNGTNTLAGVPFVHVSMTYEEISNEVKYSAEDYNAINISRMPFISKHFDSGSWIGATDDIMKEDKYLATKLKFNKDEYMGFVILHGKDSVLGTLTIAFPDKENHPSKTEISRELMKASQRLCVLLDR